jgi:hypothetical protein
LFFLILVGAFAVWLVWPRRPSPKPAPEAMSLAEARSVLGLGADADAAQIRAAYTRLMRDAHPDFGGASEAAARLNAARDRLRAG